MYDPTLFAPHADRLFGVWEMCTVFGIQPCHEFSMSRGVDGTCAREMRTMAVLDSLFASSFLFGGCHAQGRLSIGILVGGLFTASRVVEPVQKGGVVFPIGKVNFVHGVFQGPHMGFESFGYALYGCNGTEDFVWFYSFGQQTGVFSVYQYTCLCSQCAYFCDGGEHVYGYCIRCHGVRIEEGNYPFNPWYSGGFGSGVFAWRWW